MTETPAGTVIRPERPAEAGAIRAVVEEAFDSSGVADLVDGIRASDLYEPDLALVAEVEGAITGHVMISGATLHTPGGARPIMILAPLAVAPAWQRRGIGGALVRAACAEAARRGEPAVVLEGDPAYYRRFGFEHAAPLGVELPLPDWAASEAGQILRFAGYGDDLTGRVEYAPAFAAVAD